MIIAYTSLDCVARVLGDVARQLAGEARQLAEKAGAPAPQVLRPPQDSQAANFRQVWGGNDRPLFFFGHGRFAPPGPVCEDWEMLLGSGHEYLFANRFVIGICCHSCEWLGGQPRVPATTILGFRGKLVVPLPSPACRRFQEAIMLGLRALLENANAALACKVMKTAFRRAARNLLQQPLSPYDTGLAPWLNTNVEAADVVGDADCTLDRPLPGGNGAGPGPPSAGPVQTKEEQAKTDLKPEDRAELIRKLDQWARSLPVPDMPIVGFADGTSALSAPQIVDEVRRGTELGEKFLRNWVELMAEIE